MLKITAVCFALLSVLFLGKLLGDNADQLKQKSSDTLNGTLQKMIVDNGTVTMTIDLNGLNGSANLTTRPVAVQFSAATNSFFPILVFNDRLRGPEPGSISLVAQGRPSPLFPPELVGSFKQLVVEKLSPGSNFDLAVRDARSGLTFFNVEGHEYNYDSNAQLLTVQGGRLLISDEFASDLGRPADAGANVGKISMGLSMQPVEVQTFVKGETRSVVMPSVHQPLPGTSPGPDVIVGDLPTMQQFGTDGTQVGLAIATTSCNAGTENLDWFALPQTDHPVIPQNLYRMSGGANNDERFEQIGQSWLKHAFAALTQDACGFGCNGVGGDHLGSGCSDPYSASLNANQSGLGSRGWVNPFTGAYPSTADNHSGHAHDGVSHRVRVAIDDLNQSLNQGATYYGEAQYVTPHEYAWCQDHPTQCNMYNNVSYRQFSVNGTTNFTFSAIGNTVWRRPAVSVWAGTGASLSQIEPDPGNDGIGMVGYKVTNPTPGVWHYEYVLYNENLDRGIQSFSVPLGLGVNISNVGFHAPPQEPGWANDGTENNQGYSGTPWNITQTTDSITWNTETFAQNQNANAIRWGTLYNFRFDADQPPQTANATIGFFKTGSPIMVAIQMPGAGATPTPTPTPTPSATPTATSTATPTGTPRPTPTPRSSPASRPRPTPLPRP
jgi:hypothetical protein